MECLALSLLEKKQTFYLMDCILVWSLVLVLQELSIVSITLNKLLSLFCAKTKRNETKIFIKNHHGEIEKTFIVKGMILGNDGSPVLLETGRTFDTVFLNKVSSAWVPTPGTSRILYSGRRSWKLI